MIGLRSREVWGCQRCGSGDLRMAGFGDGAPVGQAQDFTRMACDRCGLMAVALIFEDEAARQKFEAEAAKAPSED